MDREKLLQRLRNAVPRNLDVHHLTYDRFGREELDDLVLLCRDCHKEVDPR